MHFKEDENSRAEAINLPAQRGPDEAAERPRRGGGAHAPGGPREARRGRGSAPLGSYRITHTTKYGWQNLLHLTTEIQRDITLSPYLTISRQFIEYLRGMEKACFIVAGFNLEGNKAANCQGLYIHRWTDVYRKRQLAKLYQLDTWWKENRTPVTLLTLTTYQNGEHSKTIRGDIVTIEQSFFLLKDGWDKISKILRKYLPNPTYIWVIEPHKSGYPHMHIVVFDAIPPDIQEKIKKLWSDTYYAGSKEHGVDFSIRTPDDDIDSIRNYLMKYIAKGFLLTGTKFEDNQWTKEELVFNALIWKQKFRTFQPSRKLQKIMKWEEGEINDIYWHTGAVEYEKMCIDEREQHILWDKCMIPDWLIFQDNKMN